MIYYCTEYISFTNEERDDSHLLICPVTKLTRRQGEVFVKSTRSHFNLSDIIKIINTSISKKVVVINSEFIGKEISCQKFIDQEIEKHKVSFERKVKKFCK